MDMIPNALRLAVSGPTWEATLLQGGCRARRETAVPGSQARTGAGRCHPGPGAGWLAPQRQAAEPARGKTRRKARPSTLHPRPALYLAVSARLWEGLITAVFVF